MRKSSGLYDYKYSRTHKTRDTTFSLQTIFSQKIMFKNVNDYKTTKCNQVRTYLANGLSQMHTNLSLNERTFGCYTISLSVYFI